MFGNITIKCHGLTLDTRDIIELMEANTLIRQIVVEGHTSGTVLIHNRTKEVDWFYEPEPTFQSGAFKLRDLELVAKAPPPDDPPLSVGDRCFFNSGGPELTVVDIKGDKDLTVSWSHDDGRVEEMDFPRACVRRSTID